MRKKKLQLLFCCLFALFLGIIASCVSVSTNENLEDDPSSSFDWNLPVAVSAGIEPDQLALLTDDELRLLYQPYVDIANSISLEFGVMITTGTFDCYFMTRDDILYAITNVSLADHESTLRELAEQVRRGTYASKVAEAMVESGYFFIELLDAFHYGMLDPVEAYYRIQQVGVIPFYEEILYLHDDILFNPR